MELYGNVMLGEGSFGALKRIAAQLGDFVSGDQDAFGGLVNLSAMKCRERDDLEGFVQCASVYSIGKQVFSAFGAMIRNRSMCSACG